MWQLFITKKLTNLYPSVIIVIKSQDRATELKERSNPVNSFRVWKESFIQFSFEIKKKILYRR